MSEDLRVVKTKENIKSHFLTLLTIYPFHKITVNMLITKCKINRSTFYRNYEDKYDLLNNIIHELLDEFNQSVHPEIVTIDFNSIDNIRQYLVPFIEFFDKHRNILLLFYKDYTTAKIFESMTALTSTKFLKSISDTYKFDQKKTMIASYYTKIVARNILETMRWWHIENPDASQDEIIEIVVRCITKGLFTSMCELTK